MSIKKKTVTSYFLSLLPTHIDTKFLQDFIFFSLREFYCVALASLELAMYTRLVLN